METTQAHAAIFAAIEAGALNLSISARAGSGKTTTVVRALSFIRADKKVLFLAFNKKIATELQQRVPSHVKAQTLNSLGHGAWMGWMRTYGLDPKALKVERDKVGSIAKHVCKDHGFALGAVTRLVRLAKSAGVAPVTEETVHALLPDTDATWLDLIDHHGLDTPAIGEQEIPMETWIGLARRVLAISFAQRDVIDFDDQLYMTVLLKAKVTRYDWVFVDEAQDLSPLQHELVARALGPDGRLVAVGDEAQAIYGFRGAASNSMDLLRERFACTSLPLHVSYRCPQLVVKEAQQYVAEIEPHASAPMGTVDAREEMLCNVDVKPGDMVVSRFCAPLVDARLMFLRRGIPAVILGQDLAESLLSLIKKLEPRGMLDLANRLDRWEAKEKAKCLKKDKDPFHIEDRAESLRLFMEGATSLEQLGQLIRNAFSDDPRARITLCTIHKSKGLEAERVFYVNQDARPGKITKAWQAQQEDNLAYVAITRAKSHLAYVRIPRRQANRPN